MNRLVTRLAGKGREIKQFVPVTCRGSAKKEAARTSTLSPISAEPPRPLRDYGLRLPGRESVFLRILALD